MKNKSLAGSLICSVALGFCGSSPAQSSIAYFNGPAFGFGDPYGDGAPLDLDQDGLPDFNFLAGPSYTTGFGNGTTGYEVAPFNTNNFLRTAGRVAVVPVGTVIGDTAASNTVWTNLRYSTLMIFGFNSGGQFFSSNGIETYPSTEGWGGPVTPPGEAFLGVRFYSADGLHYG